MFFITLITAIIVIAILKGFKKADEILDETKALTNQKEVLHHETERNIKTYDGSGNWHFSNGKWINTNHYNKEEDEGNERRPYLVTCEENINNQKVQVKYTIFTSRESLIRDLEEQYSDKTILEVREL